MIHYKQIAEFEKDLKKLLKHYGSLLEDMEVAKKNAIELYHIQKINNNSVFPIPGFCSEEVQICKLKKFACKALKGRGVQSGVCVIYAFHLKESLVEFIEIYFKGDKENEDKERIKEYLQKLS